MVVMVDLRSLVAAAEDRSGLPPGQEERFAGYGVMGLPFRSGHLLALRSYTVSARHPTATASD